MVRQVVYIATAFLVTVVYWALAVYVVTRNPRRTISWVFFAFGFAAAGHYVSSLFLYPRTSVFPDVTPFALRWKWASGAFGLSFYFHLLTFYFPPRWQCRRAWLLGLAYLASAGLAITALLTDLLVAGPLYRPAPHTIGAVPGPLMLLYVGFHMVMTVLGVVGVIVGFLKAPSLLVRRQVRSVLLPTGLLIASSAVNWGITLTQNAEFIPHEISDLCLAVAGGLYARAVLRYGSLIGHPLDVRGHLYSIAGAVSALVALYLGISLDRWLASYLPFPLPVTTGLFLLIVVAGYPAVKRWLVEKLDRLLFRATHQRRETIEQLIQQLIKVPDPEHLQAEMLRIICMELGVYGGYLAVPGPDCQPDGLVVQTVQGNIPTNPGDVVQMLHLEGREPVLCTILDLQEQQRIPGWQDIALFCPLPLDQEDCGVLALGEKRDDRAFTHEELTFCREMVEQLSLVSRMMKLRDDRDDYVEAAQSRDAELHDLERQVEVSVERAVFGLERRLAAVARAPLEICALGPMQVVRDGKPIPEKVWGTERAKAMLAYLLWKGHIGATRDEMVECLWPNQPVERASNVFHVTMHRLRKVLEPELRRVRNSRYILCESGRYRFNFDAPHWLDVTGFQDLSASGNPAALRKAVALYRGSYLQDVNLDLPPDAEIQRRALERLYVQVLRKLIAQLDDRASMPFSERLLVVEPAEGTAHRAFVLGCLARGRRDLARQQVVRWRKALAECDLEPSVETRLLWNAVEDGAVAPELTPPS